MSRGLNLSKLYGLGLTLYIYISLIPYMISGDKKNINKKIVTVAALLIGVFLITPGIASANPYNMEFTYQSGTVVHDGDPVHMPDIDVVRVESNVVGNQIELTIEVDGSIRNSNDNLYTFWMTPDPDEYDQYEYRDKMLIAFYRNGESVYYLGNPDNYTNMGQPSYQIDGGELVLSIPFSPVDDHLGDVDSFACMVGAQSADFPNVPLEYLIETEDEWDDDIETYGVDMFYSWADDNGDAPPDDDDKGDDSPGFALLLVGIALVSAVLIYHKKNR